MLKLDPLASEKLNTSIFITGPGRTGSTMFGNLIHSMKNVEYAYEPSMLFSLIPLIETLPAAEWRLLFETYAFEDFLSNVVAGRRLNLNPHDLSSVYKVKSENEIEERLSYSHGRASDYEALRRAQLAMKIVDAVPFLSSIRNHYPGMKTVVMFRRLESIISSLMRKGWLADAGLSGFSAMWPYKDGGAIAVPFWVPDPDVERFAAMSELERCCYYFLRMYEAVPEDADSIIVDYDTFKTQPAAQYLLIAERLGLKPGPLTQGLLDGVEEPAQNRDIDLGSIDPLARRTIEDISERLKERAVTA